MRVRGWKLAYGVGHFLNDICATVWFSYTLLYFQRVLCFPSSLAGIIILTGQVADGISTVFVGLMADKDKHWSICRYGKRKLWHLLGTTCVIATFPFIFNPCLGCSEEEKTVQLWYFVGFVVVFQFGWASVQISHLSLIPSLTKSQRERTELNALRYGFTVTANILVYVVAWVVLGTVATDDPDSTASADNTTSGAFTPPPPPPGQNGSSGGGASSNGIGPSDAPQFRLIVLSTMAVGVVTSLLFHVFTKEPMSPALAGAVPRDQPASPADSAHHHPSTVAQWLRRTEFWMLSLIYMSVRLYVNLSMTYITLYLHDYLKAERTSVAVFPLIMYIGGFSGSLAIKLLNHQLGRRISLGIGSLLGVLSAIGIFFGSGDVFDNYLIYVIAIIMGAGGSIMLVTALAATSDIIGSSVKGAFVYGALSFCDKLSNGIVVEIIQNIKACTSDNEDECGELYKYVLVVMCGGTSTAVLLVILLYRSQTLWHPREVDPLFGEPAGSSEAGSSSSSSSAGSCRPDERTRLLGDASSGSSDSAPSLAC